MMPYEGLFSKCLFCKFEIKYLIKSSFCDQMSRSENLRLRLKKKDKNVTQNTLSSRFLPTQRILKTICVCTCAFTSQQNNDGALKDGMGPSDGAGQIRRHSLASCDARCSAGREPGDGRDPSGAPTTSSESRRRKIFSFYHIKAVLLIVVFFAPRTNKQ